ncbi:MAG: M15 family metallopeptidase [Actinomycetota bacterium]
MPNPVRASARRTFPAVVLALVVGLVALVLLRPDAPPVTQTRAEGAAADADGGAGTHAKAEPTPASPPAYLAWIPGGFPPGFRDHVRTADRLAATVVVAGDTRWLTASHDASGAIVDHPMPPLAIPIDAFAVNPVEYAPFLPDGLREEITGALNAGEGVLSARSAKLRGLGVGGTLTFGGRQVRIGVVVPDETIGWSELLVSRQVGEHLGIVDDRYLLAQPADAITEGGWERLVAGLLPDGTPIRTVAPGGSTYMRVASGVNPPIVMKRRFGEFAARVDADNPAYLTIDPRWVTSHLATRSVPLLGRVTCNVAFFPPLVHALRQVEREDLGSLIHSTAGCFNARTVARDPTAPPSNHAYGAAIDINAPENAYGAAPTMDERIVAIFERWGFRWGGDFLIPDGMHFEYGTPASS